MQKIPTLFLRDPDNLSLVTREVNPDAAWVLAGEGIPTVKRDGTNVRIDVQRSRFRIRTNPEDESGMAYITVWKRRNPTREEKAAGAEPDYVLVNSQDPANKHILAAVEATDFSDWPDGKWPCEAIGPKIQGGIESDVPGLYPFSWKPDVLPACERTFDGIKELLRGLRIEGIVWHNEDGLRFAKIKRKDMGFPWPIKG